MNTQNHPINNSLILVFDVETTGLLPRWKPNQKEEENIESLPYVTQFSFILYDIIHQKIIKSYNSYIKLPPDVLISDKITELTGVTRELLEENGTNMEDVLKEFYSAYCLCDVLVAHNLSFDSRMVDIEIKRNLEKIQPSIRPYLYKMFHPYYCKILGIHLHCTMKTNIEMCNIQRCSPAGKPYIKFPTLCELHEFMFGTTPANLHNSLIDVLVCLRCYLKKEHNIHLTESMFQKYCDCLM